jgi:hypothetical protein
MYFHPQADAAARGLSRNVSRETLREHGAGPDGQSP